MQENLDKQIEKLVDKVMDKASLEKPSTHFTATVMSEVLAISKTNVTSYQPLISKRVWFMILIGIIALVVYIISMSKPETSGWLQSINLSFLSDNILSRTLSEISYSKTTIYAVLTLASMFCVQILLLKNYFDKRLEV